MKRNSRQTIGALRQITDGREEEHPGSGWDAKVHGPTGLTYEELRYKAWDAVQKGGMRPAAFAEQYGVSVSFVRKWHRIIEAGHELFRRDHHRFTLEFISKSVTTRPKKVVSPVQDSIADAVVDRRKSHPFEGSKRIREALGLDCSTTVIDRVLRDRGLTRRRPKRRNDLPQGPRACTRLCP